MRALCIIGICATLTGCWCWVPAPLGYPGPYGYNRYNIVFQENLEITVIHPDPAAATGNWPIIIFSTGWNQARASFESYGIQLAQWGFVAILRHYPSLGLAGIGDPLIGEHSRQISAIIDWCQLEQHRPGSPLSGRLDLEAVGVAGFSAGGGVSIRAALDDPRIGAAVPLEILHGGPSFEEEVPYARLAELAIPVMYIGGDSGGFCQTPPNDSGPMFDSTPAPALEVVVAGADHLDFSDGLLGYTNLVFFFCPEGTADPAVVHALATRYMISWFQVWLRGDTSFATNYDGAGAEADVRAGLLRIRSKLPQAEGAR